MNIKDRVLGILEVTRNNALSKEAILKKLSIPSMDINQLEEVLDELLDEKLIYCVNSNLGLFTLNPFVIGIFKVKKNGDCYVSCNGKDISINSARTYGAMDGDKVRVRITDFNTYEGSIKEIVERHGLLAELKTINGKRYAYVSDDNKYLIDVDNRIVDGTIIGIKVDKIKTSKFYHATLDRVIGHKNAPKIDEMKILYEYEFPVSFSEKTKEELNYIPTSVSGEEISKRSIHDLREKTIFTIDGDDTKDIDDAISLEILDNGNYLLGVHIADVSYYVKDECAIDLDARDRTTSVYMPGVVSPMYPTLLSNGICSLNPGVDRLAVTCEMELDKNGKLINFDIFKSVIHSNIQMTYKNVNKILDEGIIPLGYEKYVDTLKNMNILSDILTNMRKKRGMVDFDRPEVKINVDANGKPINIDLRSQGTGENLIENFMLCANECVGTYLYNMGVIAIYRVHDTFNIEKLKRVFSVIKGYGIDIKTKINYNDPYLLQKVLYELKDNRLYDIISSMVLRCMAKASYNADNIGHFAVGINKNNNEAYVHFTSPIRRYPDTIVHRILSQVLEGDFSRLINDEYKAKIIYIANECSNGEVRADSAEREADKMKMAEYMMEHINEEFDGRIVSFTNHGMYVELSNFVEGRVAYKSMDDYYRYDEDLEVLVGDRTKKVYRLGDMVRVVVVRASKDEREIDLELVRPVKTRVRGSNGNNK